MVALFEALLIAVRELFVLLWKFILKSFWPQLLSLAGFLGLKKIILSIWQYFQLEVAGGIFGKLVKAVGVVALLHAWAVFLFIFWNWSSLSLIKDLFSSNPFAGVSILAGSLYLASHAFPFHMMFGTMAAYISWRFTLINGAIFFNRVVVYLRAGVYR